MKNARSACIRWFFAGWFGLTDRLLFAKHHWMGELPSGDLPVLLISNHLSWWDGIWVWQHNRRRWKRNFAVPVLAKSIKKWPFLSHLGALPLARGKGLLAQCAVVQQACSAPNDLLLIFPEGRIRRALPGAHFFQKALLARFMRQSPLQWVMLYQAVVTGNRPRAEVFHFLEPVAANSVQELEQAYAQFAAACEQRMADLWNQQMEAL